MGAIDLLGGFPSGVSGIAIANAAAVAQRLDTLTRQAADGRVAATFSGLGAGLHAALVTGPALAAQQALQSGAAAAGNRMQLAQTALAQIGAIASQFYAQANNLNGLNPGEVDSIAASARGALRQVAELLNSTDGDIHLFAGQDAGRPPVPDAGGILASGFFQQIQAAVGDLATEGGAATAQATLAIARSDAAGTTPFSTYLSQPGAARPVAPGLPGGLLPAGILANANADVASLGASTTGSYMRDVLRGLATIGSLAGSQADVAGFGELVSDTRASLAGAITALNQDAGAMGDRQAALKAAALAASDTVTALRSQLSDAQDVDMAETLSRLSQAQTQLRSSYQLIADSQSLSLLKYLAPGG